MRQTYQWTIFSFLFFISQDVYLLCIVDGGGRAKMGGLDNLLSGHTWTQKTEISSSYGSCCA